MAYIDGSDVAALAADVPGRILPDDLVIDVAVSVADALDHAHENGLLHRDVKPGNILVGQGRRRRVYLADFGIAKPQDSGSALTSTGAFVGSLAYCAPEQAAAEPLTGAADQYQLACTIFEMLVGAPPYSGPNLVAVLHHHLTSPVPSPRSRRPALPPELDAVFSRALAKTPSQRYLRCADFADDLVAALTGRWTEAIGPAPVPTAPTPHPPAEVWRQSTVVGPVAQQPLAFASTNVQAPIPPVIGSPIAWTGNPHPPEHLRGLACGAYFALSSTDDPVDELLVTGSKCNLRKQLRETWGIIDGESAEETIELLMLGLDAPDYDPVLAAIRSRGSFGRDRIVHDFPALNPSVLDTCLSIVGYTQGRPDVLPGSVAAWDISRLVILVRYSAYLEFLHPYRAWEVILEAGRKAAQVYPDWREYAAGLEWGRAFTVAEGDDRPVRAAEASFAETRPTILQLVMDPTSPWCRLPLR